MLWTVFLVSFAWLPIETDAVCGLQFTSPQGVRVSYDLSSIGNTLIRGRDDASNIFTLNPCGTAPAPFCDSSVALCAIPAFGKECSIGDLSTLSFQQNKDPLSGVTAVTKGSRGSTTITFMCDPEADPKALFSLSPNFNPNQVGSYTIKLNASFACPQIFDCSSSTTCRGCTASNCTWCADDNGECIGNQVPCGNRFRNSKYCPPERTCNDKHGGNCDGCAGDKQCHFCWIGRRSTCLERGESCPPDGTDVTSPSQCSSETYCRQNQTDLRICHWCLYSYGSCSWCLDAGKCLSPKQMESSTCQDSITNYRLCPATSPPTTVPTWSNKRDKVTSKEQ